jgi:hypothetical protein
MRINLDGSNAQSAGTCLGRDDGIRREFGPHNPGSCIVSLELTVPGSHPLDYLGLYQASGECEYSSVPGFHAIVTCYIDEDGVFVNEEMDYYFEDFATSSSTVCLDTLTPTHIGGSVIVGAPFTLWDYDGRTSYFRFDVEYEGEYYSEDWDDGTCLYPWAYDGHTEAEVWDPAFWENLRKKGAR